MRRIYLGCFLMLVVTGIFGQCANPATSFTVSSTSACAGTPTIFTNTTPDSGLVYSWDFCAGEITNDTPSYTADSIPGVEIRAFKIVNDNGQWYGFATDISNSGSFWRIFFGSSLDNLFPTISPISRPGGSYLGGIDIIKEVGKWYGLVADLNHFSILRIDFDSITDDSPNYTTIATGLPQLISLKIAEDKDTFYVFGTDGSSNAVTEIILADSITNISPPVVSTITGSPATSWGFTIHKFCDTWVGLVTGWNSNTVARLTFTNGLGSVPVIDDIGVISQGARGIDFVLDGCSIYAFFNDVFTNALCKISFGNNITTIVAPNPISFSDSLNSGTGALMAITDNSVTRIFSSNLNNFYLMEYIFPQNCNASIPVSSSYNPPPIYFSQLGTYTISLTAIDTVTGNCSSYCQTIQVLPDAPPVDFIIPNTCTTLPVLFQDNTANAPNNATWYWNFGDASTDTNQNSSHNYSADGTFQITHAVNVNGCTDTIQKTYSFHDQPIPNFAISNTCFGVNDTSHFQNLSTCYDSMTYHWDFGDSQTSTTQSPTHHFSSTGTFNLKLVVTSDSGCVDSITIPVIISNRSGSIISYSPQTICGNTPVTFTDTYLNLPDSYLWNFGVTPIATSSLSSPTFSNYTPGNYTVTLIASTGSGCYDSTQISLTANPGPIANYFFDTVCLGFPTMLTDSSFRAVSTDPIDTFIWMFRDSAFASSNTDSIYYHIFQSCGMDTLIHIVKTQSGCIGIDTHLIFINCPPNAGSNFNPAACNTAPVQFTDTSLPGLGSNSIISRSWNFGDSSSGSNDSSVLQNPFHTFSNQGDYEIYLIVTNSQGCVSIPDSASIQIIQGPEPLFTIGNYNICQGAIESFTDHSIGNTTWEWNFDDTNSGVNNNSNIPYPTHQYDSSGRYFVSLTVSEVINPNLTCFATNSSIFSINVHPIPNAYFKFTNPCVGSPAIFKDSSWVPIKIFHDSINWWSWTVDSSYYAIGNSTQFTFMNAGTFLAQLVVLTNFNCSDTVTDTITVQPSPTSTFTFSPNIGIPPLLVTFLNNSQNANTYSWNFGDGSASVNIQDPIHIFDYPTCDTITLTTMNNDGCSDSSYKVLCLNNATICIGVDSLSETINGNIMTVTALIINTGSVPIYNFDVMVNVGGSILDLPFNDTLSNEVPYSDTFRFQQSFVIDPSQEPAYVCLIAENPNGITLATNTCIAEQCLDLSQQLLVFDLYPNPTLDNMTLDVVVPLSSEIVISVYDVIGRLVEILYDGNTVNGFNQYTLYTFDLAKGCYLLTVDFRDERIVKKVNKF